MNHWHVIHVQNAHKVNLYINSIALRGFQPSTFHPYESQQVSDMPDCSVSVQSCSEIRRYSKHEEQKRVV